MNRVINILKTARENELNRGHFTSRALLCEINQAIEMLASADDEDACNVTDCNTCESEGD